MILPAVRISGIDEVQRMLTRAPKQVVLLGYGRALTAGINVIASAVAARTPIRAVQRWNPETFSEFTNFIGGNLASSLTTEVTVDANARGGIASVGFGNMGHVANWVEYGHRMVTHKPGKREVGEVVAHPFMRPAADASADPAIDAFCAALVSVLQKGIF